MYDVHELLGKGSFGSVFRAVHRENKKTYAIKMILLTHHMTQYVRLSILNELRILATAVCPFIVTFKEAYVRQSNLCIVTEFASKGDLQRFIRTHAAKRDPIHEQTIWHIFLQISIAVDYLHKLNVLHRDLKPANVLLDANTNVKLADMGIVKILRNSGYGQTQIGTPLYMSPETLKRERYGTKSDSWALGCVLYEMMHLKPAFSTESVYILRNQILAGQYVRNHPRYSPNLNTIVTSLIRVTLRNRLEVRTLLSQREIVQQLHERKLTRSECVPEVKPLFYKACTPPVRVEDWAQVIDMFCDLNHTIKMSDSVEQRMNLIRDIRTKLEQKNVRPRSSRVLPSPSKVYNNKILLEIQNYQQRIQVLQKQISDYEKIIARLKQRI